MFDNKALRKLYETQLTRGGLWFQRLLWSGIWN